MTKKNKTLLFFSIAAFLASFIIRLIALEQTSYANGWDAYYYLIQIKALITEGKMHSPDISTIYPLLLLIVKLSGNYILSFKVTAAITAGLVSTSIFLLAHKLSNSVKASIIVASLSLFSPTLTFFTSQFPKNLLGLSFLFFFIYFFMHKRILWYVIFGVLAFITHRLAAGLLFIFIALWLLFYLKQKHLIYLAIPIVFGIIASQIFPGIIHLADIERFNGLFSFRPQIATLSFIQLLGTSKFTSLWYIELILFTLLPLIAMFSVIVSKKFFTSVPFWIFFIILFFLMLPFYTFSLQGTAYRFFLVAIVISPIFIVFIVKKNPRIIYYSLLGLILGASFFSFRSYNPNELDPPYAKYDGLTQKTLHHINKDSISLIIAHKALAEFFTFSTGIDALPWRPEDTTSLHQVKRLSYGIANQDYHYYLQSSDTSIVQIALNYHLIDESLWLKFIEKVKSGNDEYLKSIVFSWNNPYKQRPNYLLRNKN